MTYLISDEVPESDLNKITGKISGFVNGFGGKITKEDIWGRRKLAYPIKKQDFATYVTVYFNLPALKLKEFDRELRLLSGVLRHLILVKDYGTEELVLTAEEVAETKEIEEVIGGEKSFEAVEGETEESLDLMAKREKTEEPEVEVKEAKKEKVAEKTAKEVKETEKVEETKEEKAEAEKAEKAAKAKAKKAEKKKEEEKEASQEAERLSKLNDELNDILKDEL